MVLAVTHFKAMASTKKIVIGFFKLAPLYWRYEAILAPTRQPRKSECVQDCYKKLHFRPLLISMHKRPTSLIETYTRNAF